MNNNNQSGRGIYGKGYYIALVLCAAAIGVTGYLYYRNTEQVQPVIQAPEQQATLAAAVTEENLPAVATEPVSDDMPVVQIPVETPKKALKTASPLVGETVAEFSMECLSYNQTTRDWRVHNGVDIAAEAGTEVLASADGEVYTVYNDDMMGTTVVIRHDGGYTTQYASLSEELQVKVGDRVTLGQVIGTVGETALLETAVGPHVHFSVLLNDKSVDPAEFLALTGE